VHSWLVCWVSSQVPILIHENVGEFPESLITDFLSETYWCYSIIINTCAVGGCIVSRRRRCTICYHNGKTEVLAEPFEVYNEIAAVLSQIQPAIPDVFLATTEQLIQEVLMLQR
jgi:hypothetical protein